MIDQPAKNSDKLALKELRQIVAALDATQPLSATCGFCGSSRTSLESIELSLPFGKQIRIKINCADCKHTDATILQEGTVKLIAMLATCHT